MAKSYTDLKKQIAALEAEAERLRGQEVADVVARIKEAIAAYGLTAADLGLTTSGRGRASKGRAVGASAGPGVKRRAKSPRSTGAKYRNDQGQTWGGRGPRPKWLRDAIASGKSLQDFAV